MDWKRFSAYYGLVVGIVMIVTWIYLLSGGAERVPELENRPVEMVIVIIAEAFTAMILILGGLFLHLNKSAGERVILVGIGSLSYSVLTNLGYVLQDKDYLQSVLMLIFLIVNMAIFGLAIKDSTAS